MCGLLYELLPWNSSMKSALAACMRSVWSANVFDTGVMSLILNAVPLEGEKQIQCGSTVSVELHRMGKI